MYIRLNRTHRVLPVILGVVALASVAVLLAWDAFPRLFPARAHDILASFPLAMIALFVLDVFLVIAGWPATSPDESFAETCAGSCRNRQP
jgi:hypothetical protein